MGALEISLRHGAFISNLPEKRNPQLYRRHPPRPIKRQSDLTKADRMTGTHKGGIVDNQVGFRLNTSRRTTIAVLVVVI